MKRKSPEGAAEFSRLNKVFKKSARVDDQKWADNLARDLEDAAKHSNQREVWQGIMNHSGRKKCCAVAVRDGAQNIIGPLLKLSEQVWEFKRVPEDWLNKGSYQCHFKKGIPVYVRTIGA